MSESVSRYKAHCLGSEVLRLSAFSAEGMAHKIRRLFSLGGQGNPLRPFVDSWMSVVVLPNVSFFIKREENRFHLARPHRFGCSRYLDKFRMFRHWLPPIFVGGELTTVSAQKAKAMSESNCSRVGKEWIEARHDASPKGRPSAACQ